MRGNFSFDAASIRGKNRSRQIPFEANPIRGKFPNPTLSSPDLTKPKACSFATLLPTHITKYVVKAGEIKPGSHDFKRKDTQRLLIGAGP